MKRYKISNQKQDTVYYLSAGENNLETQILTFGIEGGKESPTAATNSRLVSQAPRAFFINCICHYYESFILARYSSRIGNGRSAHKARIQCTVCTANAKHTHTVGRQTYLITLRSGLNGIDACGLLLQRSRSQPADHNSLFIYERWGISH